MQNGNEEYPLHLQDLVKVVTWEKSQPTCLELCGSKKKKKKKKKDYFGRKEDQSQQSHHKPKEGSTRNERERERERF